MSGDLVEATVNLDIELVSGLDGVPRVSIYLSFSKILRIEVDCILREQIRGKVSAVIVWRFADTRTRI